MALARLFPNGANVDRQFREEFLTLPTALA